MILHELDNHPEVVGVVFDGNHLGLVPLHVHKKRYCQSFEVFENPHDVGGVLSVWVLAVLVGQKKTSVGLFQLKWTLAILGNQLLAKRSYTLLRQKLEEKKDSFNLSPL